MELADMYLQGHGIRKNNDEAIYWACKAAQSGEYRALKFRIKLALKTTSDNYQPQQCSQVMKSRFRLRKSIVRQNLSRNLHCWASSLHIIPIGQNLSGSCLLSGQAGASSAIS